jgi:hypothetical protein
MTSSDAFKRVATAVSKGIRNYSRVVKTAKARNLTLDMAELHEQSLLGQADACRQLKDARCSRREARKHQMLVTQLCISVDEARDVCRQALEGDVVARENISKARKSLNQGKHVELSTAQDSTSHACLDHLPTAGCL